jgi:hypothetical protein
MSEALEHLEYVGQGVEKYATEAPKELQQALVVAMRSAAKPFTERAEVLRGLVAAESIPTGLVIAGETEALALVDQLHEIVAAQKQLGADVTALLAIPRAMEKAIREEVRIASDRLEGARVRGGEARVAWQQELRRRAAAEEQRQRAQARKVEEEAIADAIAAGDDVPPPAEIASPLVARQIAAGLGVSGTMVRVDAKEIVDDAECPAEWKGLLRGNAEGAFRYAEKQGKIKRPAPGESIVWQGVRFESVERAVNR